ncbi:MAG: DUF6383 domain-containing protein [Tannerella sp.]|jgi:hypothetical protein|nr:DUF6383 domain-containing protein [Tannerella sp.]
MNKKIFTLLATAFLLLSTAFSADAAIIGGTRAIGDTVRTLKENANMGMYHIRIDSVYWPNPCASPGPAAYHWVSVPYDATWGNWNDICGDPNAGPLGLWKGGPNKNYDNGDTLVLAVTEDGRIIPVSINDLRGTPDATLTDLQSTMWCIDIKDEADLGQWPTFHFTNKIFATELDMTVGEAYVTPGEKGWLFSPSYDDGQLEHSEPLYRTGTSGNYLVLVYDFASRGIRVVSVPISDFIAGNVAGMLKFTIMQVAPYVLDAEAFNTMFGNDMSGDPQTLKFDPAPNSTEVENPFGKPLKARPGDTGKTGYLNVAVNGNFNNNIIYNRMNTSDESLLYYNLDGVKNPRFFDTGLPTNANNYNDEYRFVYFPSDDSLVINAYEVWHSNSDVFVDGPHRDNFNYLSDGSSAPLYYGLYNEKILNTLIIRRQDLYGKTGGQSLMTIGKAPANSKISLEINCTEIIAGMKIEPGVYTIWDDRGRILGVRIYNGSLAPQWIELAEGECPDRIPSYQWVIEKANSNSRSTTNKINITNREFGNLFVQGNSGPRLVSMTNVLVQAGSTPRSIFQNQSGLFTYGPFAGGIITGELQPIIYGRVAGQYLTQDVPAGCKVKESQSGFRAVPTQYTSNEHLGYKWFRVDNSPGSVNFMKSDNWMDNGKYRLGMDHNAFAFNYFSYISEDFYINQEGSYDDSILVVDRRKDAGFRLQLAESLRNGGYLEEPFGYPTLSAPRRYNAGVPGTNTNGTQRTVVQDVAQLKRFYYQMKIADFYTYRDQLTEQYVVLKGAHVLGDPSDLRNALKYGLADAVNGDAKMNPFDFANVYLRETYFLVRPSRPGDEERSSLDTSRRVYYAIMDRIESAQIPLLKDFGLEVSDTLAPDDKAANTYGLVVFSVDDANAFIKAQGRTVSSARVSTFALENMQYDLYRRLNSWKNDINEDAFDYEKKMDVINGVSTDKGLDAPKVMRIMRQNYTKEYMYESGIASVTYNQKKINFFGVSNEAQNPETSVALDGFHKFDYNLFIDTAFINRGTGPIKPQYMIAVGIDTGYVKYRDRALDCCTTVVDTLYPNYTYGRYLINATDSARFPGSNGAYSTIVRDDDYVSRTGGANVSYDRLVFVPAIHDYKYDRLYILSQLEAKLKGNDWYVRDGDSVWYDIEKLNDYVKATTLKPRLPLNSNEYADFYQFSTWDNNHNDVTFSLRFDEPRWKNVNPATGEGGTEGGIDTREKSFRIESETAQRNPYGNPKIAPLQGGWVMLHNGIAVLSRTSYEDDIQQGEIFNIEPAKEHVAYGYDPVSNAVVGGVQVIAGSESVTILNASGRNVTVTNLLGQTVVRTVLTSDNATVKAPKGVVVVQVEGEKTVKAIVK